MVGRILQGSVSLLSGKNSKAKINLVIRVVEPTSCPSLTKGVYAYDYGDTAQLTPLMKMHTLGHDFIPDPIHSGITLSDFLI